MFLSWFRCFGSSVRRTSACQSHLLNELSTVPGQSAGAHVYKLRMSGALLPHYASSRLVSFDVPNATGSFEAALNGAVGVSGGYEYPPGSHQWDEYKLQDIDYYYTTRKRIFCREWIILWLIHLLSLLPLLNQWSGYLYTVNWLMTLSLLNLLLPDPVLPLLVALIHSQMKTLQFGPWSTRTGLLVLSTVSWKLSPYTTICWGLTK